MRIFLVGGAVRDGLLGLPPGEKDWVVTGAHADEMVALGFRRMDPDIPVFLHPQTGDEYALARRETKRGAGHKGFSFDAGPDVPLEEDLRRRDVTINAMAQDESGAIIDPYGGQRDLSSRLLRHVSPAFREDPLRVLRLARFAAQLAGFQFEVAAETASIATNMSEDDDLLTLTPTRCWREFAKALSSPAPELYLVHLTGFGALSRIMPWLAASDGADDHSKPSVPEALADVAANSTELSTRLATTSLAAAAWGAAGAPPGDWPIPREARDLLTTCLQHPLPDCSDAGATLAWLESMDAWRRGERFARAIAAWRSAHPDRSADLDRLARATTAARGLRPPAGAADPRAAVRALRRAKIASVLGDAGVDGSC